MVHRKPTVDIRMQDESAVMAHVIASICDRFPDVDKARITAHAEEVRSRYADARVREYVPVMVEREVTDKLREAAEPAAVDPVGRSAAVE